MIPRNELRYWTIAIAIVNCKSNPPTFAYIDYTVQARTHAEALRKAQAYRKKAEEKATP